MAPRWLECHDVAEPERRVYFNADDGALQWEPVPEEFEPFDDEKHWEYRIQSNAVRTPPFPPRLSNTNLGKFHTLSFCGAGQSS